MLFRKIEFRALTICWLCSLFCSGLLAENVQFIGETEQTTTTGYSLLKWELKPSSPISDASFVLQQSTDLSFSHAKTLYQGPDLASFVSGLPDGSYYYRVGVVADNKLVHDWSTPLSLTVKHHSRKLALALFITGIVIFLATTGVIVLGNVKYNQ